MYTNMVQSIIFNNFMEEGAREGKSASGPQKSQCSPAPKASNQSSVSHWSFSDHFMRIIAFVSKLDSRANMRKVTTFLYYLRFSVTRSRKSI